VWLSRLGITQFLIREGIAKLEEVRGSDGKLENVFVRVRHQCFSFHTNATTTDHSIQVHREKVLSDGKDVVGKLLVELQVRKSTADGPGAREFYVNLTKPIPGWEGEIRDLVLKKKLVRLSHFLAVFVMQIFHIASENLHSAQHFHR
jgi:dipeptidyl-peptidase-3